MLGLARWAGKGGSYRTVQRFLSQSSEVYCFGSFSTTRGYRLSSPSEGSIKPLCSAWPLANGCASGTTCSSWPPASANLARVRLGPQGLSRRVYSPVSAITAPAPATPHCQRGWTVSEVYGLRSMAPLAKNAL
jgi:hypothetical protein